MISNKVIKALYFIMISLESPQCHLRLKRKHNWLPILSAIILIQKHTNDSIATLKNRQKTNWTVLLFLFQIYQDLKLYHFMTEMNSMKWYTLWYGKRFQNRHAIIWLEWVNYQNEFKKDISEIFEHAKVDVCYGQFTMLIWN